MHLHYKNQIDYFQFYQYQNNNAVFNPICLLFFVSKRKQHLLLLMWLCQSMYFKVLNFLRVCGWCWERGGPKNSRVDKEFWPTACGCMRENPTFNFFLHLAVCVFANGRLTFVTKSVWDENKTCKSCVVPLNKSIYLIITIKIVVQSWLWKTNKRLVNEVTKLSGNDIGKCGIWMLVQGIF